MGGMGGSQNQVLLLESTHRMKHNNSGHGKPGSEEPNAKWCGFFTKRQAYKSTQVKGHGPVVDQVQ